MKKSNILKEQPHEWLRKRLQRCELQIIKIAQWDEAYFYDGNISNAQQNRLIPLFKNRQSILNKMFSYTENEIARLETLNSQLISATEQMMRDFRNLYQERLCMDCMTQYDNDAHIEARIEFHYHDTNAVLKMPEDEYYSSKFSSMLNILSVENSFTYPWCSIEYAAIAHPKKTDNIDALYGMQDVINGYTSEEDWRNYSKIRQSSICTTFYDLYEHHLYSIPDILRMNSFSIHLDMKQKRII